MSDFEVAAVIGKAYTIQIGGPAFLLAKLGVRVDGPALSHERFHEMEVVLARSQAQREAEREAARERELAYHPELAVGHERDLQTELSKEADQALQAEHAQEQAAEQELRLTQKPKDIFDNLMPAKEIGVVALGADDPFRLAAALPPEGQGPKGPVQER